MNKIKTVNLREGMVFTKSVYIDLNNMLVTPGQAISKSDIERLKKWDIIEVETAGELVVQKNSNLKSIQDVNRKEKELQNLVEQQNNNRKNRPKKQQVLVDKTKIAIPLKINNLQSVKEIADKFRFWNEYLVELYDSLKVGETIDLSSVRILVEDMIETVTVNQEKVLEKTVADLEIDEMVSHAVNCTVLSIIIGTGLKMEKTMVMNLALGSLFIDVGMFNVPYSIINKKEALNEEERKKVHAHPVYGYKKLVQQNGFPLDAGKVVLEHHEQLTGKGYPRGLKDQNISIFGKIGALVDAYDAMTKKRTYRNQLISYEAMRVLISSGGTKYDQNVLKVFLQKIGVYPVGSVVQLNNNCIGKVIKANSNLPMRPDVLIVRDEFGDFPFEEDIVKLQGEKEIYIVKPLTEEDKHKYGFEKK